MGKFKFFLIVTIACFLVGCGALITNNYLQATNNIKQADSVKDDLNDPENGEKDSSGKSMDKQVENPEKNSRQNHNVGVVASESIKEDVKQKDSGVINEPQPTASTGSSDSAGPVNADSVKYSSKAGINYSELEKLDNKRYAWWLRLNSEHNTPGVPDIAKHLCDTYDGIYIGDSSQKVVYLTFDEGYENGYTSLILDTLLENDAKAAFFVTGPYIEKNYSLVKRMLDEGHVVGNHSINHPSLPSLSIDKMEKELFGLEERYYELFGERFLYMRPPMGEYSERVMALAQKLGYRTTFWSFAYKDYDVNDQKGPEYAYDMIMKNLHNGAVILLHAVSSDNAYALDKIIKDIRARGYELRLLDL